jgi:uncharacterized membrane-anchored protein
MFVRRGQAVDPVTITGVARVDTRTKRLVKRLQPGDIAVIDHIDLDRVAAESLVACRPAAVVNASPSVSDRYPSGGAFILVRAGIPLIDGVGPALMQIADGAIVDVTHDVITRVDAEPISGVRQTLGSVEESIESARACLSEQLAAFAENTLEYLRKESHLLFDPPDPPQLKVNFRGRHVMVVVRGHGYREDLQHLRSYVRDVRPIIIAVDGGADVCLEHGLIPDIIIGDFDSITDNALGCGAQLVVHAYVGGGAPGAERLRAKNLPYVTYEAPGMSEDVAMLLAYDEGAELIVAVGTHASMVEFLDKGRAGMASTFLTRLKVGPRLVDAKGVSRLYRGTIRTSDLSFLIASALVAFMVMALVLEPFRTFLSGSWFLLSEFFGDFYRVVTPW